MKKTIYAIFAFLLVLVLFGCNPKEVTITFQTNGGDPIEAMTILQESTIDAPTATKEGFTFLGWYQDESLTQAFDDSTVIVRNFTLYASWSINAYTVTFDFNDGVTADSTITDDYNSSFTYPDIPYREGYTFEGWYLEDSEVEYTKTKIPAADTTIIAEWSRNEYTVNFYLDAQDTEAIYTEQVLYQDPVSNPPAIPVITGYDGAWSENITSITEDLDVYAEYTIKTFTVSYQDYQGNVYTTQTVDYGSLISAPSTPSRTGYDFIGYYNEASGFNIDLSTYTVTEDVVLQDNFQIQTFSVKFYGGDDGILLGSVQYIDYGSAATAPTSGYDRDGYTFSGWDADYSNITGDLNVYAEYDINQYTISFDANNGVYADQSTVLDVTADYNAYVTEPEEPTRAGFIFVGWFTELTYENEVYFGTTGVTMPIDGFTVYARWEELVATTYTVSGTYYFEECTIASDNLSFGDVYTTTSQDVYTPFINVLYDTDMTPVRDIEGYEFYKYVYNGVDYYNQNQLINITQDETVDVYYRRVVLTVTFSEFVNDQNNQTTYYIFYNGSLNSIPTPTPVAGMTVEWERQTFENIKTDLSVAAIQYDDSLQTVIFVSNGSIIYISSNDTGNGHAIILAPDSALWNISQDGYRFEGWYIQGTEIMLTEGNIYYDDSYFTNNITSIEARWVALNALNEANNVEVVADAENGNLTISFDVLPTDVNGLPVFPEDFIFILNGLYIQSSDVSADSLMNYISQDGNSFTLTLTSTDPYYSFFESKLIAEGALIPGIHTLQIISVGDNYNVISSDPSAVYQYEVKSIYDGIPESQTIKDYYIIEDFGNDTLRYIFYTNLTYQFTGKTFAIETGSNHISADGNTLTTSGNPGEFTFTITDGSGTRLYYGLVVEDIRQFNIGSSYQNYLSEINNSNEENIFLADSSDSPYYVGYNNAFYLDILIRNNNGEKIDLSDAILDYEFYLNGSETALTEVELEQYVTLEGNMMYFTEAADGQDFRIVVEPKYESLMMNMYPIEYNISINDGYNAFTNQELKSLFSDMDVNLINIHRDITAELDSNQMYSDGSPINYLATPNNDYTNYGNVYYRINGGTDTDSIVLQGNFMTIDGSDIEYINPDLSGDGLISYAQSFKIVSTQIGIFYYNVYQNTPVNNNAFTMNNLRILGNTTTPSVNYGGTEEEIYNQERLMSQNSGGILGVVVRNGKADLNNLVIGYTVIGVTTNAYGEDSTSEALTVDMDYLEIHDSWANSIYLWGGAGVKLSNTSIGSSGGAAIHFEDTHPGNTGINDPVLNIGENVVFNNWISGQEAWFKAYGMSSIALALKSNINGAITPLDKTIIQNQINPVSGLETEMINLIFLSLPMNGAVTYENPSDTTSVISASEVTLQIQDPVGETILERSWDYNEASGDPRVSGGQFGFALGNLSTLEAFIGMITEIKTVYYQMTTTLMSDADAGNLATIAAFYNLTATEAIQVAGAMQQYSLGVADAVTAVKGSLDYPQPQFIEVIAPLALTGAAGNATVLIEMFNATND